jgi:hypothetical protein
VARYARRRAGVRGVCASGPGRTALSWSTSVLTYIFILRPCDPHEVVSTAAAQATEEHFAAKLRRYAGAVRFIGACQADSEREARRQLQAKLASLPVSVPALVIAELHD